MLSFIHTLLLLLLSAHGAQAAAIPTLKPRSNNLVPRAFDSFLSLGHYMEFDPSADAYHPKMGGMNDIMVGDLDDDGKRLRRRNCIFYVNQRPPMTDTNPNWAKTRALQFAALMNLAQAGGDFHTLYDAYNLEDAFNAAVAGPMADALESGLKRVWFQTTSEAFANLCEGTVYLVAEEEEIWEGSIWMTNEVDALFRSGAITEIVEIRPAEIGRAYDHGGSVYSIPKLPYRGGQPPGGTPPRDEAKLNIPDIKRPDINNIPKLKKVESLDNLDTTDPEAQPPVGKDKDIPATPPPPSGFNDTKAPPPTQEPKPFCKGEAAVAVAHIPGKPEIREGRDTYTIVDEHCAALDAAFPANVCNDKFELGSTVGCSSDPIKITSIHFGDKAARPRNKDSTPDYVCTPSTQLINCKEPTTIKKPMQIDYCCVPK